MSTHERLEALADQLEQHGEDPARVEIVRRAQRFKRSWVELAEGLCMLRDSRAYEDWGFGDVHEYCQRELAIKPSTADKLMMSFGTVQRHAPEVLQRDGVSREIPSIDAVDYFTRALRDTGEGEAGEASRRLDAPRDVIDQLRSAVFEEGSSVSELRQRFNPVLRPKPEGAEERELLRKTKSAAKRLSELVHQVPELSEARVARVDAVVEALLRDVDKLLEEAGASVTATGTESPQPARAAMKKDARTARRRPRRRTASVTKAKSTPTKRGRADAARETSKSKASKAGGKAKASKAGGKARATKTKAGSKARQRVR
jgi:hypothetical protein